MRSEKLSLQTVFGLAMIALTLMAAGTRASAQQERILHGFNSSGVGGAYAQSGVIFDSAGNLYGTTTYGGSGVCLQKQVGCGTVFELKPNGRGGWTQTVLHNFGNGGGIFPHSGLVFDKAGNLYGTTIGGGAYLYGTVFELVHGASGGWTEKILHTFNNNGTDGYSPWGGLAIDAAGNLYGTTAGGGSAVCAGGLLCGTVFELTPGSNGAWTETILHNFSNNTADGGNPYNVTPVFDAAGNLYGTTGGGGASGFGIVFELTPGAGGWTETVLHNFSHGTGDGFFPNGSVTLDASGNVYGTTVYGGAFNYGTAFELTPSAGGNWSETILHSFQIELATDGFDPSGSLILDAAGNVYGTAAGGAYGLGTVFELSPTAGGWTEKLLHSFSDNGVDGFSPGASLIFDAKGNLYGTTLYGGPKGTSLQGGVVFEVTP